MRSVYAVMRSPARNGIGTVMCTAPDQATGPPLVAPLVAAGAPPIASIIDAGMRSVCADDRPKSVAVTFDVNVFDHVIAPVLSTCCATAPPGSAPGNVSA